MTRIGSLFSGAGMLDVAAQTVFGGEIIWHCENYPAANLVLATHWPDVPNLGDITQIDWNTVEPVDILCGGFPCQDVSTAAVDRRLGLRDGNRSGLWAYMADAINALQPALVIIENVRGLLNATAHRPMEYQHPALGNGTSRPILRAAGAVLGDLADLGYDATWATVSAASVGAPHKRERVFIVAHPTDRHSPLGSIADTTLRALLPVHPKGASMGANVAATYEGLQPANVAMSTAEGIAGHTNAPAAGYGLLPTPQAAAATGGQRRKISGGIRDTGTKRSINLPEIGNLLPTPSASDGIGGGPNNPENRKGGTVAHSLQLIDLGMLPPDKWGRYSQAIQRWEQFTRPAPNPIEPYTTKTCANSAGGTGRLNPAFAEWMMGWPPGWATNIPGITRNDALRIIGNGVIPQQATTALRYLLTIAGVAA